MVLRVQVLQRQVSCSQKTEVDATIMFRSSTGVPHRRPEGSRRILLVRLQSVPLGLSHIKCYATFQMLCQPQQRNPARSLDWGNPELLFCLHSLTMNHLFHSTEKNLLVTVSLHPVVQLAGPFAQWHSQMEDGEDQPCVK